MNQRAILLLYFFISSLALVAQQPFFDEITEFKKTDSINFPGKGKILFVGSSSFRLWKDLQSDFPAHPLINRGFGGSTFDDLLFYKAEIIKPYQPKQVVIYCGENDLAGGALPEEVLNNFRTLFSYITELSPETHILFVSIKPSPSRKHILESVRTTNRMIKDFLSGHEHTTFVDTFSLMLNSDGSFREELFVEDRLHMNRKGYEIWKSAIFPHLR